MMSPRAVTPVLAANLFGYPKNVVSVRRGSKGFKPADG